MPPDIAHDCFEGFAVDLISSVIVNFVRDKLLSLEEFNDRIETFNYSEIDKQNKPQVTKIKPLTNYRVKQTACEMWNLLRLLPFLIGDVIPDENPVWEVYIEFLDIIERICAPSFTTNDLIYLQQLTDEFFTHYRDVFPANVLKPKAHFLSHYPAMIARFGPLVKTLRFEAKNGYFKNVIQLSKNRMNMCKTMAKRHQMLMFLDYKEKNLLDNKLPRGIFTQEVPLESLEKDAQNILKSRLSVSINELLVIGKAVVINGQRYSENEVVVLGFRNDEYIFGLIIYAIFYQSRVYLLCQMLDILSFDTHYHAYDVSPNNNLELTLIEDLLDYHPLGVYSLSDRKMVPLRHHIRNNDDT